ncbi:4-oxalocrotonate tautomerase [Pseudomonas yamanorum]|nr:4-oxalocrotonate tautomerase [Pseudomonas yamanorum]NWD26361.1 4-oxalocrotonate tautomerase [Pseudomonas yamanorum]
MPTVRVELSPGRSHDQKSRYVEQVTRLTSEILGCPVESVDVMFVEIAPYDWARAGRFFGKAPDADGQ